MRSAEPAVDTAGFNATLQPPDGKAVGASMPSGDDFDLRTVLERLAQTSEGLDAPARVAKAAELLRPAIATMATREACGVALGGLISGWRHPDPLLDLTSHLTLAIPLNNMRSDRCVTIGLRRALQSYLTAQLEADQEQLALLIELALLFYDTTDLDVELFVLRDVFREARTIPFPLLARIGRRLLIGNRNGKQIVDPHELIKTLLAPTRIAAVSRAELRAGVKRLVADTSIAEWKRILPLLYFEPSASTSEFGISCTTFLELCFSEHEPALVLTLLPKPEQQWWLARTVDLGDPGISREELYHLLRTRGVVAPEIPEEEDELLSDSFFDRVARARLYGGAWIRQHASTGNVVRLYRPRED